jgi:hypothetical protein
MSSRLLGCLGLLVLAAAGCSSTDPGNATNLSPDVDCGGCYVVNAVLTGNGPDLFVGGYIDSGEIGFVRRFENRAWSTVSESARLGSVRSLWAGPDAQLYLIAGDKAQHIDLVERELTDLRVEGTVIFGFGDEIFVLGEGTAHHIAGEERDELALDIGTPAAITGLSSSSLYALGSDSRLAHYDGESWTELDHDLEELQDIVALDGDELYAVGGRDTPDGSAPAGSIARYDGDAWHVEQDARGDVLLGIAAASAQDVFAVGGRRDGDSVRPVVWHFDGDRWSRREVEGVDAFLWDVWCSPSGTCYAAGTDNAFIEL